jgi:hypothetical protein
MKYARTPAQKEQAKKQFDKLFADTVKAAVEVGIDARKDGLPTREVYDIMAGMVLGMLGMSVYGPMLWNKKNRKTRNNLEASIMLLAEKEVFRNPAQSFKIGKKWYRVTRKKKRR